MPGRDGTGPMGQGSKTGRGMGNCLPRTAATNVSVGARQNQPVFRLGRIWDYTFGRWFRGGRGNRRR